VEPRAIASTSNAAAGPGGSGAAGRGYADGLAALTPGNFGVDVT
jgi:hypothetical protein